MKAARPHRAWILAVLISAVSLAACGPAEEPEAPGPPVEEPSPPPPTTAGDPCPEPPTCGDDCSNHPFEPTECWTTDYGPAKADIIVGDPLKSTNMLYCEGGTYALCFFSGPPEATGTSSGNRPLPCVLEGDIANCTCQAYTSGPYFVDINAILNLGAYYETAQACGSDGSGCANIENCGRDGTKPGCKKQPPAPVCQYVQNQDPNDPTVSLIPKADLISTFSFAMDGDYRLGTTDCEGLYAGCMTAPCFYEEGSGQPADGDPVQCACPTYTGPYQIGQFEQKHNCPIPNGDDGTRYVWSAAYSVAADGGS